MVADEEAAIVRDVGVDDLADDVVVEELDGLVAEETAAGDHPEPDPGFRSALHDAARGRCRAPGSG